MKPKQRIEPNHNRSTFDDRSLSTRQPFVLDDNITVDKNLSCVLLPHQIEGIQFMYNVCFGMNNNEAREHKGCILSHFMGLGMFKHSPIFIEYKKKY